MTRWQRLKRRRRVRSILYGLRSYSLAEVVGRDPRYDLLTSHVIVAKPLIHEAATPGLAAAEAFYATRRAVLARQVNAVTAAKSDAIVTQNWDRAAALRDRERELHKQLRQAG